MKNLAGKGTRCLIVQSQFSKYSFWNYTEVCKIAGAKYPATPLGLMTIAALLPQSWEFKLIDVNIEPLLKNHFEWADIVCVGGMLPQQQSMLSVINRAHQHKCLVVAGGADPTSQPHLYQTADFLIHGEGEINIPPFLMDLENNCRSGEYKSADKANMREAVIPRFDLIRFKDYIQIGIQFSRGCPFNCEFCDIIELFGRKARTKKPEQIISELQKLYDLGHRGHIDFVDDNFIGDKNSATLLLQHIKDWSKSHKYPFYFSTESSINIADDENLLQLMSDVDFRYLFIGLETPNNDTLRSTNKKININRPIVKSVQKISSYGIIVNAGFIIGFDNEINQVAENMIECIQDSGICMAMVGKLYALPNTQLTRRLKKEGRMFEEDSILGGTNADSDQMTSGLNFITKRPRLTVLKDYANVLRFIYDPEQYYNRIIQTGLSLKINYKYKPNFLKLLKNLRSFLKLCKKIGFNKTNGVLFWKMLMTVLFKNPKAVESAINLAAMYIHFQKQSEFIIKITNKEILEIERCESNYYKTSQSASSKTISEKKSAFPILN